MGIGEVGEKLRHSTVQIWSGWNACGSGVIRDAAGLIVTNAHVAHTENLRVELWDGRTVPGRTERRDARRDLAILRIHAAGLEPARYADSSRVRVGELVIAVGSPVGFTGALSAGIVHGLGPIGGLGLAVPANAVAKLVKRLVSVVHPAALGVTVRPVRIPGMRQNIALLVLEIASGSAAECASLRIGDVLLGSGGQPFSSVEDLREVLDQPTITMQFLRGGEARQREVTIRLRQEVAA